MLLNDVEMKEECEDIDEEDPVVSEFDVVVCRTTPNGELYRIQYPTRKCDPYASKRAKAKFKKSVKMLEMKLMADTESGSFDRGKAEHLATVSTGGGRQPAGTSSSASKMLDEEVYTGQSFQNISPVHYAIGFFIDHVLHLCPMKGTFEMRRSINYINECGGKSSSGVVDSEADDMDSENEQGPGPAPLRVRFLKPETEKQKKRREESSLHRSKLIEKDPWIPLDIHSELESVSKQKRDALISPRDLNKSITTAPDPEDLIQEAIVGSKMAQLDLEKTEQLIPLRRIRYLSDEDQVHAVIIKARVITTTEAMRYVSEEITRDAFLTYVRDYAHMVNGVWVIKSEMLYPGEHQTAWRSARDLALCLLTSNLPVRRSDFRNAFGLSIADLDTILNTFAKLDPKSDERRWILRVHSDETFGKSKLELEIMVNERRYWHKRWEQIHRYLNAQEAKAKTVSQTKRQSSPRRGSVSTGGVKKKTANAMKTVIID